MNKKIAAWQTRERIICMIVLGVIVMLLIWIMLVDNSTRIKKLKAENIVTSQLSDGYTVCLDQLEYQDDGIYLTKDMLVVSGWLIKNGESMDNIQLKIVMKNCGTGEYYMLPTTQLQRKDVTELFNDGYNYNNSGFSVRVFQRKIDLQNQRYELMAVYAFNGEAVLIDLEQAVGGGVQSE